MTHPQLANLFFGARDDFRFNLDVFEYKKYISLRDEHFEFSDLLGAAYKSLLRWFSIFAKLIPSQFLLIRGSGGLPIK